MGSGAGRGDGLKTGDLHVTLGEQDVCTHEARRWGVVSRKTAREPERTLRN